MVDRAEATDEDTRKPHHEQYGRKKGQWRSLDGHEGNVRRHCRAVEDGEVEPDNRVDADLLRCTGKGSDDWQRRGPVSRGNPELERHQPGLQRERYQQQRGESDDGRHVRRGLGIGQLRGHVGHVQRSERGVQPADREQHHDTANDIEDDVPHRCRGVGVVAIEGNEDVACHQHYLEPDEEIEQVPGQEGPGCPEQQEMIERVIVGSLVLSVDKQHREYRGVQRNGSRQREHEGRERVSDERDAKGCGPAAKLVGNSAAAGGVENHQPDERADGTDVRDGSGDAHGLLDAGPAPHRERAHASKQCRHNRQDSDCVGHCTHSVTSMLSFS